MLSRYAYLLLLVTAVGMAKEPAHGGNYQKIVVSDRVDISVPRNWQFLDKDDRQNLASAADGMLDSSTPNHVAALAVNSRPVPSGAIVRLSIIDTGGYTQEEFINDVKADPESARKELDAEARGSITTASKKMEAYGQKVLGPPTTSIEMLSGKLAIVINYRRTSPELGATFNVTQYHIPLDDTKVLLTLSYREKNSVVYRSILSHVKNSVVFH